MFSDIAGYTAIMGRDEQKAIGALEAHRELLRSMLPRFNGRMLGEIGDGTLTSFRSAVDAVHCACEVQKALENDPELRLRIGIHVGDVLFRDNTALGDGVNVASRIHALAPPGGICISERVFEDIRNKPDIRVRDLGQKTLKNVDHPIRVFLLEPDGSAALSSRKAAQRRWVQIAGIAAAAVIVAAIAIIIARSRSVQSLVSEVRPLGAPGSEKVTPRGAAVRQPEWAQGRRILQRRPAGALLNFLTTVC
jgi:hypothetical protein